MLDNENSLIVTSVSVAKILANSGLTIQELAVLASFLSNIASNLSIIIQTRNIGNTGGSEIIEEIVSS